MQMPGRKQLRDLDGNGNPVYVPANGSDGYRYGFGGQEKDNEIAGNGNSYTAEFWQYDPRLGRRWNIDPVVKEHESPYAAFANNPIMFIDPNGADTINYTSAVNQMPGGSFASKDLIEKSSAYRELMSMLNGIYSQVDVVFKSEDMGKTDGSVSLLYKGELVDKNFKFDNEASLSDFSLSVTFNSNSSDPLRKRKDHQAESTVTLVHEVGLHVNDYMELLFRNSSDGLVNTEAVLKYLDFEGQKSSGHLKHGNGKAVLYNTIMNEVLSKWESKVFQTIRVNESKYSSNPNGLATWGGKHKGFINSYRETRPQAQQMLRYWDLLNNGFSGDIESSKLYFKTIK